MPEGERESVFRTFTKYGSHHSFSRICGEHNLFRGYTVDSWTLKAANLLSFEAGHEAPVAPVHRSLTV